MIHVQGNKSWVVFYKIFVYTVVKNVQQNRPISKKKKVLGLDHSGSKHFIFFVVE